MGEAQGAVTADNALSPNALSPNALSPNALSPNALSPNALSPNALSPNALSPNGLATLLDPSPSGDLWRSLIKYTVGCAYAPSQSFSFSWTDAKGNVRNEVYQGILGLAPSWSTGPLDVGSQRLVSACLAARLNYYGVTVELSLRADVDVLEENTSFYELGVFNRIEGAFWGNLFSETPYIHACYKAENVEHSRFRMRDCASGHLSGNGRIEECGMLHIVGPCTDVCRRLYTYGGYYTQCDVNGGSEVTDALITVGLK
ncbi:ppe family protein [Minicystis rosea]|nr:ppe family protein [Minicystis rosea]